MVGQGFAYLLDGHRMVAVGVLLLLWFVGNIVAFKEGSELGWLTPWQIAPLAAINAAWLPMLWSAAALSDHAQPRHTTILIAASLSWIGFAMPPLCTVLLAVTRSNRMAH